MIEGLKVTLSGREFTVAPVTRGLLKKYREQFKAAAEQKLTPEAAMAFFGDVGFECLKRNYPDLTEDQFDDLVDVTNAAQLFAAAMGDLDGVQRAGEMWRASLSGNSTGTMTQPAFAAIPDGTGQPPSA